MEVLTRTLPCTGVRPHNGAAFGLDGFRLQVFPKDKTLLDREAGQMSSRAWHITARVSFTAHAKT